MHDASFAALEFAGNINFDAGEGIVTVEGSPYDDDLFVHDTSGGGVELLYTSGFNGIVLTRTYPAGDVNHVVFKGREGDDYFENFTSVDSTANGNQGDDTLIGGDGRDQLFGDRGEDDLFGGRGKDVLSGGPGNDDLFGGDGADRLLGGNGNDDLLGQGGRDGLFGGPGVDVLLGGPGADRFLKHFELAEIAPLTVFINDDIVADKLSEDVTVSFKDAEETSVTLLGSRVEYTSGDWLESEIEAVDEAFAELVAVAGNNSLLRSAGGEELTFHRVGVGTQYDWTWDVNTLSLVEVASPTSFNAWSSGTDVGTMYYADSTFSSRENAMRIVFHEIGHEWENEKARWEEFKAISGWIEASIVDAVALVAADPLVELGLPNHVISNDGKWYYDSTVGFARGYGQTNPFEDFATAFANFMMDEAGENYPYLPTGNMTSKLDFMFDFIATL
ncbi:MAG: calcium-binding protein [Planctomycetota bacterium]